MSAATGNAKSLLGSTLKYSIASVLPAVTNFAAVLLYGRLLGPAEYGRYALVLAWVAIANAFLFQGLRAGARRYLVDFEAEPGKLLSALATSFLALIGLALAGTAVAALVLFDGPTRVLALLGVVLLAAQGWYELSQEIVFFKGLPGLYGKLAAAKAAIAIAVGGTAAAMGLGAPGVIAGVIIGWGIPGLWALRRFWWGHGRYQAGAGTVRMLVVYGLPLIASYALQFVLDSSDRLLLGWLRSDAEVGTYAMAYDLTQQTLVMLMVLVNLTAFPAAVRIFTHGTSEQLQEQLKTHVVILLAVALPAGLGLAVLAPAIAQVMVGEGFREAVPVLMPVVVLGVLLSGLKAFYFDLSFQLTAKTSGLLQIAIIGAAINVGLNLWWIPAHGGLGAAWATVVAFAVALVASIGLGRRNLAMPFPAGEVVRVLVAAGVMALVVRLLPGQGVFGLAYRVVAGVITYAAGLLVLDPAGARGILLARTPWGRS